MNGPMFLLVYGLLAVAAILACRALIRGADASRGLATPNIPAALDPLEAAYLRDGEESALDVALLRLRQSGAIKTETAKRKVYWLRDGNTPSHPTQLEAAVYAALDRPLLRTEIGMLVQREREAALAATIARLRSESLLTSPALSGAAWAYGSITYAALAGVAVLRIVLAVANGKNAIGFLLLELLAVSVALPLACYVGRLTDRGRRYLERLQLAFPPLARAASSATEFASMVPLLVGLYGVQTLANTEFASFGMGLHERSYARSAAGDAGGCGSFGGSSGGCSGGGGGGCGGGCGGGGGA